jgi:hypothetical protein
MRPISEVRRARLRELVEENVTQVAVADRLGKNKNQIYQWLLDPDKDGARNIRDDTAREIETAFSKPRGWMDSDPAQSDRWPSANQGSAQSPLARLDQSMIDPVVGWAKANVAAALGNEAVFDPCGDIPLFVAAYNQMADPSLDARARYEEALAHRETATRGKDAKQGNADPSRPRGGR